MSSLHDALGGLRDIAQWFVWRLDWSPEEGKYLKTPCAHDGSVFMIDSAAPKNWSSYGVVRDVVLRLNALPHCATKVTQYALGFRMTPDCGYWFFDLDCDAKGDYAQQLIGCFPGALVEWSSSGKGVHVIGRAQVIPPHRTKPPRDIKNALLPLELEFYHEGRGIAFGLSGEAAGNADSYHDAMVAKLCAQFFPPRAVGERGEWEGPRADWRGPDDDDELIRRALNARQSAASAFGGKASFAALWAGNAEKSNESDMALAAHLAFWTGCDAPRIERLMLRSGMVREKWTKHRTYLRELTIQNACDGCIDVYKEPERNLKVMHEMYGVQPELASIVTVPQQARVSPELLAQVDALLDVVSNCGTLEEMLNDVIPAVQAARLPAVLGERLVGAINKQLAFYDAKLPVAKLRAMICPPMVAGSSGGNESPLWVQKHCYVKDGDYFLDMENGARLTYQGFVAEHGRLMPMKDNGSRENAAEWALHRWGMRTVHMVAYRPDQGSYFEHDGLEHANTYNPASVPAAADSYSEKGVAGITAFQALLHDMCGKRDDVYLNLLYWLAHNVQFPGVKVRWSPVIKGTHGDGKTLISMVMRAVMGYRNVGVTGNSTLTNNGGFNDWAMGSALNIIEEIMLTGKERHKLYNAMKEFISNDVININPKGRTTYKAYNCSNHLAYTNHNDAIPLDDQDRRWFVVFTPWASLPDLCRYCGLTAQGWAERTAAIDHAFRYCAGELRAWFLSLHIPPTFDPRGSAPITSERQKMMASSRDDAESVARQLVRDGTAGITENVISTVILSQHLKMRAVSDNFDLPRGPALAHMLTRMGYSKMDQQIKFQGYPHTVWVKNGFNGDIRDELGKSSQSLTPTLTQLLPS